MPIPKPLRPARRMLLRDVVQVRLRDAIVAGDLMPDEEINETEVEQWSGASRTPVREALDRLAALGLVVITPQRGTKVTSLDLQRTRQAFSLLGELVAGLFAQVVPHLTSTQREAVVKRARHLRTATDVLATDGLFDTLVAVIGNPRLRQVYDELAPYVLRTWNVRPSEAPSLGSFDAAVFCAAVSAGEADTAEAAFRIWLFHVEESTVQGTGEVV